ncbi:hypothetical protein AK812_SmicGene29458 [Symbiodinium microadriaticum]|uniref:Uncharacterized protein n=1 Tax=Symbiodinium microadriaticum TaxID=2951 RepID=A0A1Q9D1N7_SYMMI|nr:hypothetical protein AK812_SmicGene29458 [Symbiodinium microadriaticum]
MPAQHAPYPSYSRSPAPSTVDMRGSLENPSSAPSPLSGGAAWELSDSSHQSLNLSTNSSSRQVLQIHASKCHARVSDAAPILRTGFAVEALALTDNGAAVCLEMEGAVRDSGTFV